MEDTQGVISHNEITFFPQIVLLSNSLVLRCRLEYGKYASVVVLWLDCCKKRGRGTKTEREIVFCFLRLNLTVVVPLLSRKSSRMGLFADLSKYPAHLFMVILLSAVGGFLFGYDTGVIAGASLTVMFYFNLLFFCHSRRYLWWRKPKISSQMIKVWEWPNETLLSVVVWYTYLLPIGIKPSTMNHQNYDSNFYIKDRFWK